MVLSGVFTFGAVFLAYWLALRQDRSRESRELNAQRKQLLELFKQDLESILKSVKETTKKEFERVYGDAWDSAKASGGLSLLTNEEYTLLNDIYLTLRSVNDWVDDIWRLRIEATIHSVDMDFYRKRIWILKDDLGHKILEAQSWFQWATNSQLQSVNRETNQDG